MYRSSRRAARPQAVPLESRTLLTVGSDLAVAPQADPFRDAYIRFRDGSQPDSLPTTLGGQLVRAYDDGPALYQFADTVARDAAVRTLSTDPSVAYAETVKTVQLDAFWPNDPQFSKQTWLSQPNGIDDNAAAAWSIAKGNPSVIVAVIDSGIDLGHPDLAGAVWTNPGEVAGDGVDNDRDGFIDDVNGWNFLANNNDVTDTDGHGTHVAGTIGAIGNNGIGVAGLAYGVTLMPLKFIGSDGNGSIDDAVRAIYYAVDHGARVINASWGGNDYSQALDDAIRYAGARNVVFVTAAGNDGVNNDVFRSYPASERLPNVISVAAVDANGNLAGFSDYGPTTVDVAAPGVNVRSTVPGGYASFTGTSMATPQVAATVALVAGLHPELTATQLVQQVLATARVLPGLIGKIRTGGIIDAAAALAADPFSTVFQPPVKAKAKKKVVKPKPKPKRYKIKPPLRKYDIGDGPAAHSAQPDSLVVNPPRATADLGHARAQPHQSLFISQHHPIGPRHAVRVGGLTGRASRSLLNRDRD